MTRQPLPAVATPRLNHQPALLVVSTTTGDVRSVCSTSCVRFTGKAAPPGAVVAKVFAVPSITAKKLWAVALEMSELSSRRPVPTVT